MIAIFLILLLFTSVADNPELVKLVNNSRGEIHEWVEYLFPSLPVIDRVSLDSERFLSDLKSLQRNLDSLPWGRTIPNELFKRYVLPLRVSQEPIEYFRADYATEIYERVKDCDNMEEAVLRVNEWAYERIKYEPTQRWDQNAEATLKRGIGRCEEMAILFIKACRAVCIPARQVYTPWWPFTNSNHAWVEVWTGKEWHFIGAAEMTPLDQTWFTNSACRAGIVLGVAWGEEKLKDELVYKIKDGVTLINLTPNYAQTVNLSVTVRDSLYAPVDSATVSLSVFNYSALRPIALSNTDNNGKTSFIVGKTDLFIIASKDSLYDFKLVSGEDSVTVVLNRTFLSDTTFWIRSNRTETAERQRTYTPPQTAYLRHDLLQEELQTVPPKILSYFPDSSYEKRLLSCLNRARGNRDALLWTLDRHREKTDELLSLWEIMEDKDLVVCDSLKMERLSLNTERMRKLFDKKGLPDSLFWKFTGNPRILWEDFGVWQDTVYSLFHKLKDYPIEKVSEIAMEFIVREIDTLNKSSYFGGMMNPKQILRARMGNNIERLSLFVGIMRALGVPARIKWDHKSAQFFDGKEWKSVNFDKAEKLPQKGVLYVTSKDLADSLEYYEDFSINILKDGTFRSITPEYKTTDTGMEIILPVGVYYLMTGWRNAYGDAFVRIYTAFVDEDTTSVTIDTGLPPLKETSPGDLLVRKWKGIKSEKEITDVKGRSLSGYDKGVQIIGLFNPNEESSVSTAISLAKRREKIFIFVATDDPKEAKNFCKRTGLKGRIFTMNVEESPVPFKELPSIILLKDGEAVMWLEGLNRGIDKIIKTLID